MPKTYSLKLTLKGVLKYFLDEIIDHDKDNTALTIEEAKHVTKEGIPRCQFTTQGRRVLIPWKDGPCNWVALKGFKDSFPLKLSEYAIRTGIQHEPDFS